MSLIGGKTRQEILYPHGQPECRKKDTPKARRTLKNEASVPKPTITVRRRKLSTNEKAVAELLHQHYCNAGSHESDGDCPWHFSSWDSPDDVRRHYLKKTEALLKVLKGDADLALKVIEAISS
ncbi:MAG TPA: hypothetical protein VI791_01855 [Patescibacteria group bacterium]|nr:hypothetical protein [Patescibacteria group bacterium]